MKKIILSIVLLLPLSLLANEPIQLNGQYVFNRVETILVRDTELVPSMNTKRYKELVAEKYNCSLRGNFFYCQKFILEQEMPTALKNEMNRLWEGRFFEFIASSSLPSITNESESLMEWDVFDRVNFEGFFVPEYHYYLIRNEPEIHKISINFGSGKRWMIIQNDKSISTMVERTIRISDLKTRIFNIDFFSPEINTFTNYYY